MIQKFVHKHGGPGSSSFRPQGQMTIAEVVHQTVSLRFLDLQINAITEVLMHMASIMQEGEQVRLAELLHHVPVAVPFVSDREQDLTFVQHVTGKKPPGM